MERNVSMVLFLNSEWEEFIFSLGNFPCRIHGAGWETGAGQLCSHMGVTLLPVTSPRAALLAPSAKGRRQRVRLHRVREVSTAGMLGPVAIMPLAPMAIGSESG